ncbi:hypothetical protein DPMN_099300 [Dreissena polymorpha]|uniref:Uncharacterized protein n=1 Tax=Dreissena polymorpha TaxID=45954 RepID=A0A9D4LG76_DREPO|nr:hypothetical protein DPMN_099300 [Dreissena polymorpha]
MVVFAVNIRGSEFIIEAENMIRPSGQIMSRANASNNMSVLLHQGDMLSYEFCLMAPSPLKLVRLLYSNDGGSDRIRVSVDKREITSFDTVVFANNGLGWNTFRSESMENAALIFSQGTHLLTIFAEKTDQYGVEIDMVTVDINSSQSHDSFVCEVFCFDNTRYHPDVTEDQHAAKGLAVQKTRLTKCAEEDNVNIPVFHESTRIFTVTASLPKYTTFANNRGADFTNCEMAEKLFSFSGIGNLNRSFTAKDSSAFYLNLYPVIGEVGSNQVGRLVITFPLSGPTKGEMESETGLRFVLHDVHYSGTLLIQFDYFTRYGQWSSSQHATVVDYEQLLEFNSTDFSLREGSSNEIRITFYSTQKNQESLHIGKIYAIKRIFQQDVAKEVYNDGKTAIEVVKVDLWWRVNQTMAVTISNADRTDHGVHYFRVYQRVPWSSDSWCQVFVMYQDGNIRILPITPHGLDWIPFGSSVIIGQTNPADVRPCAPIDHVDINTDTLQLTLHYADGGVVTMKIVSLFQETRLLISNATFVRPGNLYPFFTFRSMYVSEGNSDVDRMTADDGHNYSIIEPWGSLPGTFFAFYRQCISKHNTLSPDIQLNIIR